MSVSLFNVQENLLRKKAVIGSHDYQNSCEHSLLEVVAKADCKIEPQRVVTKELHSSLAPQCSPGCQSESGQPGQDLEGLQFPVWSSGPLRISHRKEQPWNEWNPSAESSKAGSEESYSGSEDSDSSVEELELNFDSQIHISVDNYVHGVQEGEVEECKIGKGIETPSCYTNQFSRTQVSTSASLVAATARSANENTDDLQTEGLGKSLLSSQSCTVGSTKLRSALRGGYEEAGLGCRPSLHVTWASDVYEPICTIVSHTVSSNHRRHHSKKDHKHRHRGKVSHSDSRKKAAKKVSLKSRHIGEPFVLRSRALTPQSGKCSLYEVGLKESRVLPCNDQCLKSVRLSSTVLPQHFCANGMVQLGERRLAKLDAKLPFSWHFQSHRLVI